MHALRALWTERDRMAVHLNHVVWIDIGHQHPYLFGAMLAFPCFLTREGATQPNRDHKAVLYHTEVFEL